MQILNAEKAQLVQNFHEKNVVIRNIGLFYSFKTPSQLEIYPIRNCLNRRVPVKFVSIAIFNKESVIIVCIQHIFIIGPGPGCNGLNPYNFDLCCSEAEPCGQFEGKCELDAECMEHLKCGTSNCVRSSNVDITSDSHFNCCYQGWSVS